MPDDPNSNTPKHRRVWKIPEDCQIRANYDETRKPKIVGYAAVFNETVEIWEGYSERIAPGAFKKSIREDDIRALINHDPNFLLGRNKSGTLTLSEDEKGLRYEIEPPDTQAARDLMTLLKRKDITQSSFGFNILNDEQDRSQKGRIIRTIKEAKLFDVSPVVYPAYPSTQAEVRMICSNGKRELVVDGESFEVPEQEAKPSEEDGSPVSDEELDREWEALKRAATAPHQRT